MMRIYCGSQRERMCSRFIQDSLPCMLGFDDMPFWGAPLLDPVEARHHSLQFPVQGCGALTDFGAGI